MGPELGGLLLLATSTKVWLADPDGAASEEMASPIAGGVVGIWQTAPKAISLGRGEEGQAPCDANAAPAMVTALTWPVCSSSDAR